MSSPIKSKSTTTPVAAPLGPRDALREALRKGQPIPPLPTVIVSPRAIPTPPAPPAPAPTAATATAPVLTPTKPTFGKQLVAIIPGVIHWMTSAIRTRVVPTTTPSNQAPVLPDSALQNIVLHFINHPESLHRTALDHIYKLNDLDYNRFESEYNHRGIDGFVQRQVTIQTTDGKTVTPTSLVDLCNQYYESPNGTQIKVGVATHTRDKAPQLERPILLSSHTIETLTSRDGDLTQIIQTMGEPTYRDYRIDLSTMTLEDLKVHQNDLLTIFNTNTNNVVKLLLNSNIKDALSSKLLYDQDGEIKSDVFSDLKLAELFIINMELIEFIEPTTLDSTTPTSKPDAEDLIAELSDDSDDEIDTTRVLTFEDPESEVIEVIEVIDVEEEVFDATEELIEVIDVEEEVSEVIEVIDVEEEVSEVIEVVNVEEEVLDPPASNHSTSVLVDDDKKSTSSRASEHAPPDWIVTSPESFASSTERLPPPLLPQPPLVTPPRISLMLASEAFPKGTGNIPNRQSVYILGNNNNDNRAISSLLIGSYDFSHIDLSKANTSMYTEIAKRLTSNSPSPNLIFSTLQWEDGSVYDFLCQVRRQVQSNPHTNLGRLDVNNNGEIIASNFSLSYSPGIQSMSLKYSNRKTDTYHPVRPAGGVIEISSPSDISKLSIFATADFRTDDKGFENMPHAQQLKIHLNNDEARLYAYIARLEALKGESHEFNRQIKIIELKPNQVTFTGENGLNPEYIQRLKKLINEVVIFDSTS